jgi:hypothetical protein
LVEIEFAMWLAKVVAGRPEPVPGTPRLVHSTANVTRSGEE